MTISHSEVVSTRSHRRKFIWCGLGAIVLALGGFLATRIVAARSFDNAMPPPLAEIGSLPITLPDGREGFLHDLVRPGSPTVITLWASWCGPCIMEAPKIAELRRRFDTDRLNIISLNVRDEDALPEMRAQFMTNAGLQPEAYAILASDRIKALTNADDVLIPRTLIFDRSGAPLGRITGYKPQAFDRVAGLVGE